MSSANPLLLERAAYWSQRRLRFLASRAEAAFSTGIALIVAIVIVAVLGEWAHTHGNDALAQARQHWTGVALLIYALAAGALIASGNKLCEHARKGWLASLMTSAQLRSALMLDMLIRSVIYAAVAGLLVTACWAAAPSGTPAPWITLSSGGGAFAAAAASAFWMVRRLQRQAAASARLSAMREPKPRKTRVIGSLSSWQSRTVITGIRPPAMAKPAALILLSIPGGEGWVVNFTLLLAGGLAVATLAAWHHAMSTILVASRWLKAQPLPATRLLLPLLMPALIVTAIGSSIAGALMAFMGLGASLAMICVLAILAVALLHAGCVAAYRHQTELIARRFGVGLVLLLAMLESYPPLTPVIWLAIIVLIASKALRT